MGRMISRNWGPATGTHASGAPPVRGGAACVRIHGGGHKACTHEELTGHQLDARATRMGLPRAAHAPSPYCCHQYGAPSACASPLQGLRWLSSSSPTAAGASTPAGAATLAGAAMLAGAATSRPARGVACTVGTGTGACTGTGTGTGGTGTVPCPGRGLLALSDLGSPIFASEVVRRMLRRWLRGRPPRSVAEPNERSSASRPAADGGNDEVDAETSIGLAEARLASRLP